MKRRLSALVAGLVLSLFTLTTLAAAAAGDYAKGRGTTTGARFSFLAQGTGAADRANGNMSHTFTSTDPNITVTGDVTCMVIVGNSATIASDNAKPSGGLDGYILNFTSTPTPVCFPPFLVFGNVITGDIEIIPGP
jgi:hypothetical protein